MTGWQRILKQIFYYIYINFTGFTDSIVKIEKPKMPEIKSCNLLNKLCINTSKKIG